MKAMCCCTVTQVVIKARVTPSGHSTFSRSLQGELNAYIRIGAVEGLPGVPRIYAAGAHETIERT
jgi:hypothetical protein